MRSPKLIERSDRKVVYQCRDCDVFGCAVVDEGIPRGMVQQCLAAEERILLKSQCKCELTGTVKDLHLGMRVKRTWRGLGYGPKSGIISAITDDRIKFVDRRGKFYNAACYRPEWA